VFANIYPWGAPRVWRVGEAFPDAAARFWPQLPAPRFGERRILWLVRATKGLRSRYDHYMLRLHDAMKADTTYQETVPQQTIAFPAGAVWICYTDQVSHAAMSGQHQLEQTFSLDPSTMLDPKSTPLAVLE